MGSHITDVLHGAHGVYTVITGSVTYLVVWHGSHTVNVYTEGADTSESNEWEPIDCMSIGNYETGETTREEFEKAAREWFNQ